MSGNTILPGLHYLLTLVQWQDTVWVQLTTTLIPWLRRYDFFDHDEALWVVWEVGDRGESRKEDLSPIMSEKLMPGEDSWGERKTDMGRSFWLHWEIHVPIELGLPILSKLLRFQFFDVITVSTSHAGPGCIEPTSHKVDKYSWRGLERWLGR